MGFIADCLTAYAKLIDVSDGSRLRMVDPGRLAARGRFGLSWWRQLLRLPHELLALVGVIEFYSHRPLSLVTTDEEERVADLSAGPLAISYQFSAEKLQRTRRGTGPRRHGERPPGHVPVCLRTRLGCRAQVGGDGRDCAGDGADELREPADDAMPAANIVCMINLDRRMNTKATVERLLRLVSLEMGIVKRGRLGLTFHHILLAGACLRRIPRLLPTNRCMATCVLSNLGEPLAETSFTVGADAKHGPLTLESLALCRRYALIRPQRSAW